MRRRQIIVVIAALLCLGGVVAWQHAHRGDPRFMGRWSVQGHGYGAASMELELTRFGTGKRRLNPSGQVPATIEFTWRADGEHLTLYWPQTGSLRERVQVFAANIWRRCNGEPEIGAENYYFEQDTADRLRFRNSIGSQRIAFELTRIPHE